MSKEDTALILKDEFGMILKYDGSGNCTLFHEQYDDVMTTKGYAGIVSTNNYEIPIPPEEALHNVANGVGDHHDYAAAGKYQHALAIHRNRCGPVHGWYKYCMSTDIRAFLKAIDRV